MSRYLSLRKVGFGGRLRFGNSLVDYSDFMDLFFVITETRNWDNSFESVLETRKISAYRFAA